MRNIALILIILLFWSAPLLDAQTLQSLPSVPQALKSPPLLDTFHDTIMYDDNAPMWWYGGLTNNNLAVRFTPLGLFELQAVQVATEMGDGEVLLWLCQDVYGLPGDTLWCEIFNITATGEWNTVLIDSTTGQFTFQSGEDFWLGWHAAGPPWELFDTSPVSPPRSLFSSDPYFPEWADTPGDCFFRALGEYRTIMTDIAVDSVWHDEMFFIPAGNALQVHYRIANLHTNTTTVTVGCHFYIEEGGPVYQFYDSLGANVHTLLPGESLEGCFLPYTPADEHRYKIEVIAYAENELNPDNNIGSIETQVYQLPAELRYDDAQPDGFAYFTEVGYGVGMKFDPHQTGSNRSQDIRVYASGLTGDLPATVALYNDLNGEPDELLWQTTCIMYSGPHWNDFFADISVSGPFYIFYFFDYGSLTSALGKDGIPASGQTWEYDPVTGFAPTFLDEDWAMRAYLLEPNPPGPWIWLTYVSGSPVPVGGGNLIFDIYIANQTGSAENFDAWLETSYEGGVPVTLVLRSFTNFQAGWAINRPGSFFPVPASWAGGNYMMTGKVGVYQTSIWDQDEFPFVKEGSAADAGYIPSDIPGDVNFLEPECHPELQRDNETANLYIHPNPFNSTTVVHFTLPSPTYANISLYNISGQLISTVADGRFSAGNHRIEVSEQNLSTGIYIVKMETPRVRKISKVVYIK